MKDLPMGSFGRTHLGGSMRRFLGHRNLHKYVVKRMRPKVALVGFAEGSMLTPWKDEGMEIWSCNDLPQRFKGYRFDRCFQFHSDHDRMRVAWPDWESHLQWLHQPHDLLIYMQEEYDNVPSGVRFPKEKIEEMVPHGWYFAHSFCWMIAFAILLEFEEIHLYGCGGSSGEPLSAMACMHYWMGVAEGKGIRVEIHGEGELFVIDQIVRSTKQYGYDLTRLVLKHEGLDPLSGVLPATNGAGDWPELDTLKLYGELSDDIIREGVRAAEAEHKEAMHSVVDSITAIADGIVRRAVETDKERATHGDRPEDVEAGTVGEVDTRSGKPKSGKHEEGFCWCGAHHDPVPDLEKVPADD